jgi:hypothetical protein
MCYQGHMDFIKECFEITSNVVEHEDYVGVWLEYIKVM